MDFVEMKETTNLFFQRNRRFLIALLFPLIWVIFFSLLALLEKVDSNYYDYFTGTAIHDTYSYHLVQDLSKDYGSWRYSKADKIKKGSFVELRSSKVRLECDDGAALAKKAGNTYVNLKDFNVDWSRSPVVSKNRISPIELYEIRYDKSSLEKPFLERYQSLYKEDVVLQELAQDIFNLIHQESHKTTSAVFAGQLAWGGLLILVIFIFPAILALYLCAFFFGGKGVEDGYMRYLFGLFRVILILVLILVVFLLFSKGVFFLLEPLMKQSPLQNAKGLIGIGPGWNSLVQIGFTVFFIFLGIFLLSKKVTNTVFLRSTKRQNGMAELFSTLVALSILFAAIIYLKPAFDIPAIETYSPIARDYMLAFENDILLVLIHSKIGYTQYVIERVGFIFIKVSFIIAFLALLNHLLLDKAPKRIIIVSIDIFCVLIGIMINIFVIFNKMVPPIPLLFLFLIDCFLIVLFWGNLFGHRFLIAKIQRLLKSFGRGRDHPFG